MLQAEYKALINQLIEATDQGKVQWAKGSSAGAFIVNANGKSKILVDNYYSQYNNITNSCISMTVFSIPSNKLLDEVVICDQTNQMDDFNLLNALYQSAKKQYSDVDINPFLTEITESLKSTS